MYPKAHVLLREQIEEDTRVFLANGGVITPIPPNVNSSSYHRLKETDPAFIDTDEDDLEIDHVE